MGRKAKTRSFTATATFTCLIHVSENMHIQSAGLIYKPTIMIILHRVSQMFYSRDKKTIFSLYSTLAKLIRRNSN